MNNVLTNVNKAMEYKPFGDSPPEYVPETYEFKEKET